MARSFALAERALEPEWLDELPAADRRARRARRDLRRVNALMGNARIVARALGPLREDATLADLGAGDGALAVRLARRLRSSARVFLVDRNPAVTHATLADLAIEGWQAVIAAADVFDFLRAPGSRFDAIVVNLFLHHFEDAALRELLALAAARTSRFVACEPRRSPAALRASRLLPLLGCNDVTRHDAVVSVRAGFRDGELSRLWPPGPWHLSERRAGAFSHLFSAEHA